MAARSAAFLLVGLEGMFMVFAEQLTYNFRIR